MSDIARTHFILTDESHVKLALICDHVRYMARLLEAGAAANLPEEELRPDAMTWWIAQVGRDLRRIVESAQWTGIPARP